MQNIQKMFASATLKLTVWYLMIVMIISLGFSALLYTTSLAQVSERFKNVEARLGENYTEPDRADFGNFRQMQMHEARENLIRVLVYTNLIIFGIGGAASYVWARQTLRPIEEAHEAQSRFTSDASHELRTPLAIMQAEIESTLRDKTASKTDYKETLQSNLEEVSRLTVLSNLLLKLARLEADSLEWRSVKLTAATNQAIQSLPEDAQKRVQILTQARHDTLTHANPESISELILILLDNAVKYSPKATPIELKIFRNKGRLALSVTNQGEGIDEKDINHIFQRFYQAESSRCKDVNQGYGLGLALAKKIVELHKGDIYVSSVKNQATTFTVTL